MKDILYCIDKVNGQRTSRLDQHHQKGRIMHICFAIMKVMPNKMKGTDYSCYAQKDEMILMKSVIRIEMKPNQYLPFLKISALCSNPSGNFISPYCRLAFNIYI